MIFNEFLFIKFISYIYSAIQMHYYCQYLNLHKITKLKIIVSPKDIFYVKRLCNGQRKIKLNSF